MSVGCVENYFRGFRRIFSFVEYGGTGFLSRSTRLQHCINCFKNLPHWPGHAYQRRIGSPVSRLYFLLQEALCSPASQDTFLSLSDVIRLINPFPQFLRNSLSPSTPINDPSHHHLVVPQAVSSTLTRLFHFSKSSVIFHGQYYVHLPLSHRVQTRPIQFTTVGMMKF